MARPIAYAIKYFQISVNLPNQRAILEAEERLGTPYCDHVLNVALRLHCMIHQVGYYMIWDEDKAFEIAKFAGRTLTSELIIKIVHTLVDTGFFDATLFEKSGILTSLDIQKGWKIVIKNLKRKAFIKKEYDLLTVYAGIDSLDSELMGEETNGKRKPTPRKQKDSDGEQQQSGGIGAVSTPLSNNNSKEVIVKKDNTVTTDNTGETNFQNGENSQQRKQELPPLPAPPPSYAEVLTARDSLRKASECSDIYFGLDEFHETRMSMAGTLFYEFIDKDATNKEEETRRWVGLLYAWSGQFNTWIVEGESNEKKTVFQWAKHFKNWVQANKRKGVDMLNPDAYNKNVNSDNNAKHKSPDGDKGKAASRGTKGAAGQRTDHSDSSRHRGQSM